VLLFETWFEGDCVDLAGRSWDLHPDGTRVLTLKPVYPARTYDRIHLVQGLLTKEKLEAMDTSRQPGGRE
jgi:hypothetical protein